MIEKVKANKHLSYFVAYSLTFLSYGGVISGLGPLIPYLAEIKQQSQTNFSILFLSRSIGYTIGAIFTRWFEDRMKLHNILIISSFLVAIMLTLFSLSSNYDKILQALAIAFGSMCCCVLEIAINVSMLLTHKGKDTQFWMQMNHGVYGIGSLIGPLYVYFFETYSFMVMGLLILAVTPLYFYLPSPQDQKKPAQELLSEEASENENAEKPNNKFLTTKIVVFLSLMFFLYIGLQGTYGGWISSYAVQKNVSTKQQATAYSSAFWIAMTMCRFIFAWIPGKTSRKLLFFSISSLFVAISTMAISEYLSALYGVWFSAIAFGITFASLFPLQFAIANQFDFEISLQQSATLMIFGALGEAGPSMLTGYLIGLISPDALFACLGVFQIIHILTCFVLIKQFQWQVQQRIEIKKTSQQQTLTNNQ